MMRFMRKWILLLMTLLLLTCQATVLRASETDRVPALDPGAEASLSVTMSYENENGQAVSLPGVTLKLYQVAALSVEGGSARYALTEGFAGTGLVLEGMSASASNQAAKTLAAWAEQKGIAGTEGATDQSGKAHFTGLTPGMYLVVQTGTGDDIEEYMEMDPYLVSAPLAEAASGGNIWKYAVDTAPKGQIIKRAAPGKITVTKQTSLRNGDSTIPLIASDSTFYVGIFRDAEGTQPYGDNSVQPVRLKNSVSGTAVFTDLPEGTYYIFETDESGNPIFPGQSVNGYTCVVGGSGDSQVTIDTETGALKGEVTFDNVFDELPFGYHIGGEISITKKVRKGNDAVTVDDTFYAGIFTKNGSYYELVQVVELQQNDTVTTEVMLDGDQPTTYWIFETDENGEQVNDDTFAYEVSGEGSVELSLDHLTDSVTITNRVKEEPEESETTAHNNGTKPGTNGQKQVQTGDDTPIVMYVVLLLGALVVLAALGLVWKLRCRQR